MLKHPSRLATLPLLVALACGAVAAQAATIADTSTPVIQGLDRSSFDPSVRPQDDLFRAVNGLWLKNTEIPADKSRYGSFDLLIDQSDARVRALIDELARGQHAAGSNAQKIADYYRSHLDTEAIERAGLAPIQPLLKEISAIKDRTALAQWLGRSQLFAASPVRVGVTAEAKNPKMNGVRMGQSGLGLPDRDYYLLKDDVRMAKAREAYRVYLGQLAGIAGEAEPAAAAQRVLALEERIATVHWDKVDNRNPVKTNNPTRVADLREQAPGFDWMAYLESAGLGQTRSIDVAQPSAIRALAGLLAELPLEDWKLYLRLHALSRSADVLPKAVREANFAFRQALTGAKTELPRWQQSINDTNSALGEAVGELWVARHFPAAYKARMQTLVANLMAAYKDSIDGLSWMSPATKAQAQDKLSKYTTKIGYPEQWRDYSRLEVKPGDAFGNSQRAARFAWERMVAKAGQPVNRKEWGMTPQTVNAYYSGSANEIVFPAAILQPPFFSMEADDAINYGAIGAVIGHEISHGFDDRGSQFDGDGVLRDWWTQEDRAAFEAIAAKLVAQYEGYQPLPGKRINGRLTLGENIADLSGLQIAYKAYLRSLGGKPAPVIGGTTGAQRFFLGFSQIWRNKYRDERLLQQLTTDSHSPGEFRANGTVSNHDGFHEAFGTKAGDALFKPAAERLRIW